MVFFLDSAALRPITTFFSANKGSYKLKKDKNKNVLFWFARGLLFGVFAVLDFKVDFCILKVDF